VPVGSGEGGNHIGRVFGSGRDFVGGDQPGVDGVVGVELGKPVGGEPEEPGDDEADGVAQLVEQADDSAVERPAEAGGDERRPSGRVTP
jgi:hypothetical protein